jgi:hypothetical protein
MKSATQQNFNSSSAACHKKTFIIFTIDVYHLHAFRQYLIFDIWAKPSNDL